MVKEEMMSTMTRMEDSRPKKIEVIRSKERAMFWLERAAISTQLLGFPPLLYHLYFTAFLLFVTNILYLCLFVERQSIRPFFFEPEAIFYIERPAILLLLLHYVVPVGCPYCYVVGLIVLILTNYVMISRYYNSRDLQKQLSKEKTQTNATLNAKKETRKNDDNMEKKKEKDIFNEDQSMEKKVEVNSESWLFDYLSPWGSSTNGIREEALDMNSSPNVVLEPSKAGKQKKKEALVEEQMQEEAVINEAEAASDLEGGSWEKVTNEHSDNLSGASESSFDQKKIDEVLEEEAKNEQEATNGVLGEEAKNEQEATGNNKSDSDSSWEEVQNIVGENGTCEAAILSSSQKELEELEEEEQKEKADETTSNYDSDDSSRNSCANSIKSGDQFLQEVVQEYLDNYHKWEYEKRNLIEELLVAKEENKFLIGEREVAINFCKQREEKYHKLQEEVEDSKINYKLLQNETLEKNQIMEKEFAQEHLKWNEEKKHLQTALKAVTNSLKKKCLKSKDEKEELAEMLAVTRKSLESYKAIEKGFDEERGEWDEAINDLTEALSHADENVQYYKSLAYNYAVQHRQLEAKLIENHSWYQCSLDKLKDEKNDLSDQLEEANSEVESYRSLYDQSYHHYRYYKELFKEYEAKYRRLKEDHINNIISSRFCNDPSYSQRYKGILQELEDEYFWSEEKKNDVIAKLWALHMELFE